MSECEHHDYTMVEDYIRGLQWSPEATDHEKSLVAGNIRGFYAYLLNTPTPATGGGGEAPLGYVCGVEIDGYRAKRYALAVNEYKTLRFNTAIYTHPAPAGGDAGEPEIHGYTVEDQEDWFSSPADAAESLREYSDAEAGSEFYLTPWHQLPKQTLRITGTEYDDYEVLTAKPGAEGVK